MSVRTAKAKAAPPAEETPVIANEVIDHWIGVRAQRAYTPVGYTPAIDLYRDFSDWHVAEYPDAKVPTESAFVLALRNAYKIRFEHLPVERIFQGKRMALCASLTLMQPLRSVA